MTDPINLADAVRSGDEVALARAITILEDHRDGYETLAGELHRTAEDTPVVGVTGSPGVGKSTLVNALTKSYRDRNDTVAILGIDPVSPVSGGAVLGDRVRIESSRGDQGVFVRSMSAGEGSCGVSTAAYDVITAMEAFGVDRIIIETVGAGQNEVEIVRIADTVLLVLQPGTGDDVQHLKAGILEIADIFALNKADRSGVESTARHLREMLELGQNTSSCNRWDTPIVKTVATIGEGMKELLEAIDRHEEFLRSSSRFRSNRRDRYQTATERLVLDELRTLLTRPSSPDKDETSVRKRLGRRELDPHTLARSLIEDLRDSTAAASHHSTETPDSYTESTDSKH